ncbi:single-stranded-DNA-specific exonuclease RecJ [bacterium]|nr:single-stranded-DNA-specific exonuclease RecJ [bacterium]
MTVTDRRWQLYPEQPLVAERISDHLGISPLLAQVLLNRQINSLTQARAFITPRDQSFERLPDDILGPGLSLIYAAIQGQQRIFVYGDYDVDGMTSTSMMVHALRKLGATVHYYLPHRFSDGYGLTTQVIPTLIHYNIDLLITLDCGITNVQEIAAIKAETHAKIVVVDHHTIPEQVPMADAIINPKYLDSGDSRSMMCTAGIVFHILAGLQEIFGCDLDVNDYLDLAAVGTVADVVPLVGENRRLVASGLTDVASRRRVGIQKLLDVAGFERPDVTTRDIGFVIAPRLNAAGRLDSAMKGVELLMSENSDHANELACILNKMNEDRQAIGQSMLQEAVDQVGNDAETESVLVVNGKQWHAGVIGITASRLVEKFNRPVVIIADDGTMGRGSARTVGSVSIYELLKSCRHHFLKFGGHREAAGFSIPSEAIDAFKRELQANAKALISGHDLLPLLKIDVKVRPDQLNLDLAESLATLSPFGQGNPAPIFYCDGLRPVEFKRVGTGNHLKITFVDRDGKRVIDAIGFGLGDKLNICMQPKIEVAFSLEINVWRGNRTAQLQLIDLR